MRISPGAWLPTFCLPSLYCLSRVFLSSCQRQSNSLKLANCLNFTKGTETSSSVNRQQIIRMNLEFCLIFFMSMVLSYLWLSISSGAFRPTGLSLTLLFPQTSVLVLSRAGVCRLDALYTPVIFLSGSGTQLSQCCPVFPRVLAYLPPLHCLPSNELTAVTK